MLLLDKLNHKIFVKKVLLYSIIYVHTYLFFIILLQFIIEFLHNLLRNKKIKYLRR